MEERKKKNEPPKVVDLRTYRQKRDFEKTQEPRGGKVKPFSQSLFVVQKHAARRLHYDLRLEAGGVLKSWAVPKGPSYDPEEKRLAVQVEDHPIEYADFEGLIPEKQYGAGAVMVWDKGTWTAIGDWKQGLNEGKLKFRLEGRKLKGQWTLVKIKGGHGEEFEEPSAKDTWLLIKHPDEEARRMPDFDVTVEEPLSVKTGRSLEQIRSEKTAYWDSTVEPSHAEKVLLEKSPAPPGVKGSLAPWPETFFPQLSTLVSRLPEDSRWISEIKFDGYRLLAWLRHGAVVLTTRRGQDWTDKFPAIARELSRLPVQNAIIDGEVVVMKPDGTTDFQTLQNILKRRAKADLVYYVFDIPYYEGHDLTGVPLIERKTLLQELISTYRERIPSIRYSDHVKGTGERVLRTVCRYGAEGIIAKRADSPYLQKRTKNWIKKKCINRQEFVVGGYTEPKGSRSLFGSLLLGYYNPEGKLIYCGNVGTGFNEQTIRTVYEQLNKLEQEDSPFAFPVDDVRNRAMHWVAPRLVAEIEFSEWTEGGHLRHPSFAGIREDKHPEEITREEEAAPDDAPAATASKPEPAEPLLPIKLTNPAKVLYPAEAVTKKDLAEYYLRVARWMLPELSNRPLVLVRCPEGLAQGMRENCFFQKHLRDQIPEGLRTVPIEEKGETGLYPVLDDLNGLLALVQLGVLEIHMLGCRADDVDHPDRMIFDLDPSPEVTKEQLREATLFLCDWLETNHQIRPFLKLTGGKGIHIVVPIKPVLTWDELKKVSKAIALEMVRRKPEWFVATVTKRKRTGKILVDYLRNDLGASSIVPYSTRALPNAPVAFPISKDELTVELLSAPVTVRKAADRLKKRDLDPWEKIS